MEDQLYQVQAVLQRLRKTELKVNAEKLSFLAPEIEYLGYMFTKDDIQPKENPNSTGPTAPNYPETNEKFSGYDPILQRYMEKEKPHFGPINIFVRGWKKEVELGEVHQKAFEGTKKEMTKETILNYPNFDETFEIDIDTSDWQLSTVISQSGNLLEFYSRKL